MNSLRLRDLSQGEGQIIHYGYVNDNKELMGI